MAKSSGHPLNLTRDPSTSHYSDMDRTIHEIKRVFQPYFAPIVIGTYKNKAGYINRIYNVPLIMLFMDENYRNQYLTYTTSLTDETTLTLRRLLSDEANLERRLQRIFHRCY